MKEITKAMLSIQKKIEAVSKDATNSHFKSKYATIESVLNVVKPIANENGIVIVQRSGRDGDGEYLESRAIHVDSSEELSSKCYLTLERQTMAAYGSALTYARRYSLLSLFCLSTDISEDDDAQLAEKYPQRKPQVNAQKPKSKTAWEDFAP